MFSKIKKLYTPEWFKLVKPEGLVTAIIKWFKVLLDVPNTSDPVYQKLRRMPFAKGYSYISVDKCDVHEVTPETLVAGNSELNKEYKYKIDNIPETFEILGCGFTDKWAVRGIDYVVVNNCYWFKRNPANYFYVFTDGSSVKLTSIGFGGGLVKGKDYIVDTSTDPTNIVEHTGAHVANSLGLFGLCGTVLCNLKGIHINQPIRGKVMQTWQDKTYLCAITQGGTFICAPKESGISLKIGEYPKLQRDPEHLFIVTLNDNTYPVSMGINYVDNYKGLLDNYPELQLYGSDVFLGKDLYELLKNQGCNFNELKYINTRYTTSEHVKPIGASLFILPEVSETLGLDTTAMDTAVCEVLDCCEPEDLSLNIGIQINYL